VGVGIGVAVGTGVGVGASVGVGSGVGLGDGEDCNRGCGGGEAIGGGDGKGTSATELAGPSSNARTTGTSAICAMVGFMRTSSEKHFDQAELRRRNPSLPAPRYPLKRRFAFFSQR
jgi:hypothetical protein